MRILIEDNPGPCRHVNILNAATGKVLLGAITKDDIMGPFTEEEMLGVLKYAVRNKPASVNTWAKLKAWLESKTW